MVHLLRIGHLPAHLCHLALPFMEQDLCAQRNDVLRGLTQTCLRPGIECNSLFSCAACHCCFMQPSVEQYLCTQGYEGGGVVVCRIEATYAATSEENLPSRRMRGMKGVAFSSAALKQRTQQRAKKTCLAGG
jgi:hypothetical protein